MGPVYQMLRRPVLSAVAAWTARPELCEWIDSRSVRVLVLLTVLAALNLFDLGYTLLAHRVGQLNELNPIAASLFKMDLEHAVVCFKAVTLLTGGFMLWRLRRSPWTPAACWLLVLVYLGLGLVWVNWSADYTEATEIEISTPMITLPSMKAAALAQAHSLAAQAR